MMDYPVECMVEDCPCYQSYHNPNKFKLSLLESDFEERWISFRVPKQIWERLHFHPCKIEVDLSELLDKYDAAQAQEAGAGVGEINKEKV